MATENSLVPATAEQLAGLSRELVAVGELLEAAGGLDWLPVARAAALVDGLRFRMISFSGGEHAPRY